MKIMFSAGEASGDLHGARLAEEILRTAPDASLIGFGGTKMREAGVSLIADLAEYSVMGFWEVAKNLGRILSLLSLLTDAMRRERPDLVVLIDYPDFNWRLARRAKKLGISVLSYIPPSAWAWRRGRAKECAALADEFISIFPFETKPYEEAGANISFVGNPLVDTVRRSLTREEARRSLGIRDDTYPVMLLPGSRRQEISLIFRPMLEGARLIKKERPDADFFLPVAPNMDESLMQSMADSSGVSVRFTHDHIYDLMAEMNFALATSGTVVLEAALMGLPSIVLYRLSPISYLIGKMLVSVKHFSLPNILMGETIQPELLQGEVNAERILSEAKKFWEEADYANAVREKLAAACALLGSPGATRRAAEKIVHRAMLAHKNPAM